VINYAPTILLALYEEKCQTNFFRIADLHAAQCPLVIAPYAGSMKKAFSSKLPLLIRLTGAAIAELETGSTAGATDITKSKRA
jgi:hypothetical protein